MPPPLSWPEYRCIHCGKSWRSKQLSPMHCAGCRTPNWNKSVVRKTEASGRCKPGQALAEFNRLALVDSDLCVEWPYAKTRNGYGAIEVSGKIMSTHVMAFERHAGKKVPEGMFILHACDNPKCMNVRHLSIGTPKQNQDDCSGRGRRPKGDRHPMAILTSEDVRDIRKRLRAGETDMSIALDFKINRTTVYAIKIGRTWASV